MKTYTLKENDFKKGLLEMALDNYKVPRSEHLHFSLKYVISKVNIKKLDVFTKVYRPHLKIGSIDVYGLSISVKRILPVTTGSLYNYRVIANNEMTYALLKATRLVEDSGSIVSLTDGT